MSNRDIEIVPHDTPTGEELLTLYTALGWGAYTADPGGLELAVANSTYVVTARRQGDLVGLARGLSDDVAVFYLQDILVRPGWQRRGIGRALLSDCLQRFQHVRTKVLLTDDLAGQHDFYRALGFSDVAEDTGLHSFVLGDQL